MCLAELAAARSLAMVQRLDEMGDNPFPEEWKDDAEVSICLEIHGLTAESLARVFVKLIPIVGQCGDPDSANEFFSAASSFFSRLAAAASVAGEEEERAFASEGASPAPDDPQPSPKPYPVNPRPAESKAAFRGAFFLSRCPVCRADGAQCPRRKKEKAAFAAFPRFIHLSIDAFAGSAGTNSILQYCFLQSLPPCFFLRVSCSNGEYREPSLVLLDPLPSL